MEIIAVLILVSQSYFGVRSPLPPLDCDSQTLLVESYASQILHLSVNLVLLERFRPEICHVAL